MTDTIICGQFGTQAHSCETAIANISTRCTSTDQVNDDGG